MALLLVSFISHSDQPPSSHPDELRLQAPPSSPHSLPGLLPPAQAAWDSSCVRDILSVWVFGSFSGWQLLPVLDVFRSRGITDGV